MRKRKKVLDSEELEKTKKLKKSLRPKVKFDGMNLTASTHKDKKKESKKTGDYLNDHNQQ
jgi:hypothetical protein